MHRSPTLHARGAADRYGFLFGKLSLEWQSNDRDGTLMFKATEPQAK